LERDLEVNIFPHHLYTVIQCETGRLVSQALSDNVTQRIDDLSKALNALKQTFDSRLNTHTAFVCAAIKENVQQLGMRISIFAHVFSWLITKRFSRN
jgi:hypothetical protein